jgi:hypothetical protein
MSAVFPVLSTRALLYAEQIRIGTVNAFSERDATLRNREVASAANGEQILADDVMLTFLQMRVVLDKAKDPAAHENVGMSIVICLDLIETFIQPVYAVSTVDHDDFKGS